MKTSNKRRKMHQGLSEQDWAWIDVRHKCYMQVREEKVRWSAYNHVYEPTIAQLHINGVTAKEVISMISQHWEIEPPPPDPAEWDIQTLADNVANKLRRGKP